jgi:hypothetical protein
MWNQKKYHEAVPVDHGMWHRVIVEVRLRQDPSAFTSWSNTYLGGATLNANTQDESELGQWHMVSKWYMSETMDPTRVLYQVPMGWYLYTDPVGRLLFEMNSSKTGALGSMNGWGRNVLVLKDMYADENDTNLFRRPVR